MMEFKIQVFENGEWHNTYHDATSDFVFVKNKIAEYRSVHPNRKYRIIGRQLMPWCEIKEC